MPCYTWPKHTWIGIFIFLYGGDCQMHQMHCSMFSSSLRLIHMERCRTFCGLKGISSVTLWSGATTPDATPELTRGLLRLSFNVPIMTRATVKINRIKATTYSYDQPAQRAPIPRPPTQFGATPRPGIESEGKRKLHCNTIAMHSFSVPPCLRNSMI